MRAAAHLELQKIYYSDAPSRSSTWIAAHAKSLTLDVHLNLPRGQTRFRTHRQHHCNRLVETIPTTYRMHDLAKNFLTLRLGYILKMCDSQGLGPHSTKSRTSAVTHHIEIPTPRLHHPSFYLLPYPTIYSFAGNGPCNPEIENHSQRSPWPIPSIRKVWALTDNRRISHPSATGLFIGA